MLRSFLGMAVIANCVGINAWAIGRCTALEFGIVFQSARETVRLTESGTLVRVGHFGDGRDSRPREVRLPSVARDQSIRIPEESLISRHGIDLFFVAEIVVESTDPIHSRQVRPVICVRHPHSLQVEILRGWQGQGSETFHDLPMNVSVKSLSVDKGDLIVTFMDSEGQLTEVRRPVANE